MKVKVDASDVTIALGNKGITFDIADEEGKHVGHLRIGQATIEWRRGRTRAGNGTRVKLQKLIELLEGQ
ncbi:hypothetical protein ACQPW1_40340 [Nocardia sp. CA-128927]|uniref:hypothetical protein n=1 Tax=Nocardia sp. CA-128927 TaxID=3239975 RepID=UPI003D95E740